MNFYCSCAKQPSCILRSVFGPLSKRRCSKSHFPICSYTLNTIINKKVVYCTLLLYAIIIGLQTLLEIRFTQLQLKHFYMSVSHLLYSISEGRREAGMVDSPPQGFDKENHSLPHSHTYQPRRDTN